MSGLLEARVAKQGGAYHDHDHGQLKISVSLSPLEQGPHAEFTAESLLQTAESKQATFVLAISAIDLRTE